MELCEGSSSHLGHGYASSSLDACWNDVFVEEECGKIVATLYVMDGMTVHMEAVAKYSVTANPVPAPSALWLPGSGVRGLLVRKRKSLA